MQKLRLAQAGGFTGEMLSPGAQLQIEFCLAKTWALDSIFFHRWDAAVLCRLLEGLYAPPAKLILGKIANAKGVFWAIPSSFAVMRLMPWHDLAVHALGW